MQSKKAMDEKLLTFVLLLAKSDFKKEDVLQSVD